MFNSFKIDLKRSLNMEKIIEKKKISHSHSKSTSVSMSSFKISTSLMLILQQAALLQGQELESRVMHGNPVEIKEFPWAVAIVEDVTYKLIGTGNIITDIWVLTAGHLWSPE
jgi:secreted trypsin-like serine protease